MSIVSLSAHINIALDRVRKELGGNPAEDICDIVDRLYGNYSINYRLKMLRLLSKERVLQISKLYQRN
jgi:hypothetical protein